MVGQQTSSDESKGCDGRVGEKSAARWTYMIAQKDSFGQGAFVSLCLFVLLERTGTWWYRRFRHGRGSMGLDSRADEKSGQGS